jgi:MOSC domain-containing protein YiiM
MSPTPRPEIGRLLAVSVAEPRDVDWQGDTIRTGIFKSPVKDAVWVGPTGVEGDGQADLSVHGGIDKAVYAYDETSTAFWREVLDRPDLGPGAFGENLTLSGWPEAAVRIGDRFRIGEVELQVSQPRQPCFKLGMRFDDPSLPKRFFASGRVGYYLRVLEPGRVRAGDDVIRTETDARRLDVQSLVAIWLDRTADAADLERAVGLEALANAWREPLRRRLEKGSTVS